MMKLVLVDARASEVMCRIGAGPRMEVFRYPVVPRDHGFKPGDWLELDGEGDEARLVKVGEEPPEPKVTKI